MIPKPFIDDLVNRIDIVEIIGSRLQLKKAGSNFIALCPFHNEKTPSFTVSPSKQFFHCFGCGAHGSAIGFLMQFEHLGFVETIEKLATQLGIPIPKTPGTAQPTLAPLHELLAKLAQLYQKYLAKNPQALAYLKKRGLNTAICQQFKIGYAPASWDYLQTIINKKPELQKDLLITGMLGKKEQRVFAYFRDRIIFPIQDRRGRIIGFGGRTLGEDLPKYLNSPETPLFHKGNELYGLYEAKKAGTKQIIVVEGYMDVVTLAQYGITNAVATLGTAITPNQIQQLLRHTTDIIFCFDGDAAGKKAAVRALENTLPLIYDGLQIKFLLLPEEHDPDSFVRQIGKEAFIQKITTASPLSEFLLEELKNKHNLKTIDGRAALAETAKPWLQKIKNSVFKQLLLDKLAKIVQIQNFNLELTNPITKKTTITSLTPLENAINILLHYPQLHECITSADLDELKAATLIDSELLINLISLLKNQAKLTLGAILEYWREHPYYEKITILSLREPLLSMAELKHELISTMQKLRTTLREQTIKELMDKASANTLTNGEKQQLQQLISLQKTVE